MNTHVAPSPVFDRRLPSMPRTAGAWRPAPTPRPAERLADFACDPRSPAFVGPRLPMVAMAWVSREFSPAARRRQLLKAAFAIALGSSIFAGLIQLLFLTGATVMGLHLSMD